MADQHFAPCGVVTLTTDFGTRDGYVGAMKGVMLRHAPGLSLIDVGHEVEPQNVTHGAVVLRAACPEFSAGTVHLGVVDPGVGTDRAGLVVLAGGHAFVGPDNGLFALGWMALGGIREARRIDGKGALAPFLPARSSSTFHGRDVFAPTAAALASGRVSPSAVGPPLEPVTFAIEPASYQGGGALEGRVTYVDRFGNAVTNVSADDLARLGSNRLRVTANGQEVSLVRTYGEVAVGARCALIGSEGFLEIAIRGGNAAAMLSVGTGTTVRVDKEE